MLIYVAAMKPSRQNEFTKSMNSGVFVENSRYLYLETLIIFTSLYKLFSSIHDSFQLQATPGNESEGTGFVPVFFMMYRVFFGDSLPCLPQSTSLRLLLIGYSSVFDYQCDYG